MNPAMQLKGDALARVDLLDTDFEQSMFVSIASSAQDVEIDRLRHIAYANAVNFDLPDPGTIARRRDPVDSICLVVGTRQTLAATMRIAVAPDRIQAERLLEGDAALPREFFPGVVLSRGATDPRFRGNGLMGFLVSLGVAVARQSGVGSALGVQIDGTPHFAAMAAAGWQSRTIRDDDLALVRSEHPLKLVYIGRDRFASSADASRHAHARLYQRLKPEPVVAEAAARLRKTMR